MVLLGEFRKGFLDSQLASGTGESRFTMSTDIINIESDVVICVAFNREGHYINMIHWLESYLLSQLGEIESFILSLTTLDMDEEGEQAACRTGRSINPAGM